MIDKSRQAERLQEMRDFRASLEYQWGRADLDPAQKLEIRRLTEEIDALEAEGAPGAIVI